MKTPDNLILAWRVVYPDFRSSLGYRWPFPGQWAKSDGGAHGFTKGNPCPQHVGDGLCLAKTFSGAASGGIPAFTKLVVGYRAADVLGEDEHKVRVKRAFVIDVMDVQEEIRAGKCHNLGGANLWLADLWAADLRGADMREANLRGADMRSADMRGADLRGAKLWDANLRDADMRGANLRGANLLGAKANKWTKWPDGFDPATSGVYVDPATSGVYVSNV